MTGADRQYTRLLREKILETPTQDQPPRTRIKRRRVNDATTEQSQPQPSTPPRVSPSSFAPSPPHIDSSDDSDEFEDVALDNDTDSVTYSLPELPQQAAPDPRTEVLTFSLASDQDQDSTTSNRCKKVKQRFPPISKEERQERKLIHQTYLVAMILHGHVRNKWCNNKPLQLELRKRIPRSILNLLYPETGSQLADKAVKDVVYSRRFLDGVRDLMLFYKKRFKVSSKGIIYKNWHELSLRQRYTLKNVDFPKFSGLVERMKGSRDIGAQGFLCLARALGLTARLVYSIQAPDVTLIVSKESLKASDDKTTASVIPEQAPVPAQPKSMAYFNRKDKILEEIGRNSQGGYHPLNSVLFEDSSYPIFWVEIWNKYTKKWLSVDPIVLNIVEVSPMRRRSKFEVPLKETRNHLTYAIAYDNEGGIMDVTRRYCQYFNAKNVKKRIEFKSEEDAEWYKHIIKSLNSLKRQDKLSDLDILELKEFRERDLAEGMPPNVADFKNHPIYALEPQLRQNEVIYPKDSTSSCGKYRIRTKESGRNVEKVLTVYKRSHVYDLKSAKAWYLRGRVLKIGVQPLKIKQKPANKLHEDLGGDDDDGVTRLYAHFQTQLFIPPAVVNGKIPRNAYGNIDVYTPSMVPENGYLVRADDTGYTVKQMVEAARILEIDYAKAVVNFDFKNRKSNKMPTIKEGGIVIDVQFKEGILAVLENIKEQDDEAKRKLIEDIALKNWKFFLTKLRIQSRLDREHGRINEDERITPDISGKEEEEEQEEEFENEGGFMMEDNQLDAYSVHSENSESDEEWKNEETTVVKKRYNTRNNRQRYVEDNSDDDDSDYYDRMAEIIPQMGHNSGSGLQVNINSVDTPGKVTDLSDSEFGDNEGGFLIESEEEKEEELQLVQSSNTPNNIKESSNRIPLDSTVSSDPPIMVDNENESPSNDSPSPEPKRNNKVYTESERNLNSKVSQEPHTSLYPVTDPVEVIDLDLDEGNGGSEGSIEPGTTDGADEIIQVDSSPEVISLDEEEELTLQNEEQIYDFEYSESE